MERRSVESSNEGEFPAERGRNTDSGDVSVAVLERLATEVSRCAGGARSAIRRRVGQVCSEQFEPGAQVLIVDPSAEWARLLAQSFEEQGWNAHCEVTLAGALRVIESGSPALVCSEMNLIPGDWQMLLDCARERCPAAKFVLISNFVTAVAAFGALCHGCDGVLTKPALAQDIILSLDNARGLNGDSAEYSGTLSLENAKKVYLANTVSECGSLAEAGRELSVERRSLRRMLSRSASERERLAKLSEPLPVAGR